MHALKPIGHNNPPSDIEIVRARLDEQERDLRAGLAHIEKDPLPEMIEDEIGAGKITERVKGLRNVKKAVEEAHKTVKAPYLECGKAVDGWKNTMLIDIDTRIKIASKPLNDFLARQEQAERDRQLALAEQERVRAELLADAAAKHETAGINDTASELMDAAAQSEATALRTEQNVNNARPAELAKARGAFGATASRKMQWVGEIVSLPGIDLEKLRPHLSQDTIQTALNAFVRNGGRECGGAVISEKVVGLNIR